MAKNYYVILGVSSDASADELRSAYRERVKEFHPDYYGPDSERFLEVQEAYSVLGSPERRQAYDEARGRSGALRTARPTWGGGTRGEPLRTRRWEAEPLKPKEREVEPAEFSLLEGFETFGPSLEAMFDRLWSNFTTVGRPKAEKIESLTVDVPLSAEAALTGGEVQVRIPAQVGCPACFGRGAVGFFECWRCEGRGVVVGDYPIAVAYPAGIRNNYVTRIPLDRLGIHNFYLTVRFCVSEVA